MATPLSWKIGAFLMVVNASVGTIETHVKLKVNPYQFPADPLAFTIKGVLGIRLRGQK